MTKDQSDAVKARIQTVPVVASKTFKSVAQYPAPNQTVKVLPPYVVIHSADGSDTSERLAAGRTTMHPRFTLHIVGETADQVEVVTGLIKAVFIANGLGIPLAVPGETCESLWWSAPIPIDVSSSPLPEIVFQIVELGWEANPA